jgi:hypothetical protein
MKATFAETSTERPQDFNAKSSYLYRAGHQPDLKAKKSDVKGVIKEAQNSSQARRNILFGGNSCQKKQRMRKNKVYPEENS